MAEAATSEDFPGYVKGTGWLIYAGIMLIIVGVLNFFYGLALIIKDELVVTGPNEAVVVVGDVTLWGWVLLILGTLEFFAGIGVMVGQQWARWFGIVVAGLALVGQFPVFFGPHPLWSLTMVILISLVLYGLAAYGGNKNAAVTSY